MAVSRADVCVTLHIIATILQCDVGCSSLIAARVAIQLISTAKIPINYCNNFHSFPNYLHYTTSYEFIQPFLASQIVGVALNSLSRTRNKQQNHMTKSSLKDNAGALYKASEGDLYLCWLRGNEQRQRAKTGYSNLRDHLYRAHGDDYLQQYMLLRGRTATISTFLTSPADMLARNMFGWINWIICDNLPLSARERPRARKYTKLGITSAVKIKDCFTRKRLGCCFTRGVKAATTTSLTSWHVQATTAKGASATCCVWHCFTMNRGRGAIL